MSNTPQNPWGIVIPQPEHGAAQVPIPRSATAGEAMTLAFRDRLQTAAGAQHLANSKAAKGKLASPAGGGADGALATMLGVPAGPASAPGGGKASDHGAAAARALLGLPAGQGASPPPASRQERTAPAAPMSFDAAQEQGAAAARALLGGGASSKEAAEAGEGAAAARTLIGSLPPAPDRAAAGQAFGTRQGGSDRDQGAAAARALLGQS